ncbi:MAG: metallophosphoesterase [Bacteroidetes bacterium]|nr:metallophosphoesterase [Bacteroidota bacterium]
MHNFLNKQLFYRILILIIVLFYIPNNAQTSTRFAVIGDYGLAGTAEEDVANLVNSWNVDFIITLGDNNYPDGKASTIDENIGQYYHQYIYPYVGSYGEGSNVNRFFPSLGNHDWRSNPPQPYYNYFELPDNERYYDFVWGDVHFFALDSDTDEPDGVSENSVQGQWLQNALSTSIFTWNVVYFHHPPYSSSSNHGSQGYMQWPFKNWGATTVIAGHDHTYERLIVDDLLYFVNGLGGKSKYSFSNPIPGSQVRYNSDYGAMLVEANQDSITFKFYSRANDLIDTYTLLNNLSGVESLPTNTFKLDQNFPNPFNPSTKIRFQIRENSFVKLIMYDVFGNEVSTIVNENRPAGIYEEDFNASNLPSGIYMYTLTVGNYSDSKKMVLLK